MSCPSGWSTNSPSQCPAAARETARKTSGLTASAVCSVWTGAWRDERAQRCDPALSAVEVAGHPLVGAADAVVLRRAGGVVACVEVAEKRCRGTVDRRCRVGCRSWIRTRVSRWRSRWSPSTFRRASSRSSAWSHRRTPVRRAETAMSTRPFWRRRHVRSRRPTAGFLRLSTHAGSCPRAGVTSGVRQPRERLT